MNLEAISDSSHAFRYVQIGFASSVPDASTFSASNFYFSTHTYLGSGEYIVADKAYTCTP